MYKWRTVTEDSTVLRDDAMTITRHVYTSTTLRFFPLEEFMQGCLQSVVKNTFPCHYIRRTDLLKPFHFLLEEIRKWNLRVGCFFFVWKNKNDTRSRSQINCFRSQMLRIFIEAQERILLKLNSYAEKRTVSLGNMFLFKTVWDFIFQCRFHQ